ncbi:hypothetical protein DL96DRAFT_1706868 [Flagelloscypha sp. PMI_526]|nr:hypothetical protein DL96DRAFT_1706868 [Flagelloscypha sp. PMI_526]
MPAPQTSRARRSHSALLLKENAIRNAFGLLLLKYLDLQDYVFGSADHCIRARVDDAGSYYEEFLPLFDVDVQFRWNGTAQAKLVLEASPTELVLIHPIALLHPSVAQVFLRQLTALDDLPESLLSYYQAPYDPSKAHLVVDYLLRAAQSHPTAIAHECYFRRPRRNQFARWLEPQLTTESKMVAVCRERDLAFYIVQLGIWKAGACYVSIDPSLPPERKSHILNDCSASLLVTSPSQASSFASSTTSKLSPESLSDLLDNLPEDSSHINLSTPTTLAYLLYTSGTTGTPKGCLLLHDGLFWAIEAMCLHARPVTQPGDKRLGLASQAFDVHVSEIVQGVVERVGITHLGMVPSMLEAMLPEGPEGLPLKYVVSGGEKISDGLIKKWTGRGGVVLANFYGPTEATIGCTSRLVNLHDRKENIGSPFEGCGVGVVRVGAPSPSFAPAGKGFPLPLVPLGTPGELVLSGHLVGVGYHQLEEATGKSFIFAEDGTRYYRTGDLVRMTPNHTLEIMGRIDSQIKLRGVRIEADGVSSVLRDAVSTKGKEVQVHTLIATHPSSSSSEQLISFCTFPTSRPPSPAKLYTSFPRKLISNMLKASENGLASYMRPNFIVPIEGESLPRGKEDTVELDANGKKVVDVLSDVLNRQSQSPQWDAKTSLWETGLTSLGFAAFTRALNAAFGTTRRTSQLFITSTASTHTTAPEDHNGKDYVNSFAELHTAHVQALIPSAHILSILPPFPHFVYQFPEKVDAEKLRSAWNDVQSRVEVLRLQFASAGRDVFGWHDDAFACFGVVQSGRTMFEDDANREHHVIAPLVCVIPLVVPFHNVRETQRRLGAIVPFQHTPLGRVHRILGLPEMVDVLFSVRYSDAEESERKEREEKCGGLKNVWVSPEVPEFVYAMEVVVHEERDLIELRVGYSDVDVEEEEVVKDLLSASSSTSSSSRLDELLTPKEEPKDDQPVDEVLEESLLSTIRSYLKLDSSVPCTPLTSFISLGLSSLRAIGLAKALTKESGKRFAAIDVVQKDTATMRMLKRINDVTEMMRQDILEHDVLLDDGDSVVIGGCTSLQSGMLTQTVNSDEGSLYIHAFTFLLSASTSPDVLHQAWTHGRWAMAIHSRPYIHFVKEDRNSINGVASSLLHLDLTKTGVKFHIICVGAAHYFIVVMHHALYDGAAVPALFERLKRNYHFSVSPREIKEEPENIPQFLPIADRIVSREHLGLRFWSSKLRDFSPFTFPRAMSSKSWRASHDIPLSMVDFATTCAKWGVHQQVFGMAAWAKALAKRSGKVDVVFGMVTSGRLIEGSELVVGPVFNTIPVRARLNSSNLVLLKSIQKWNTEGIRHQHTGLRDIQRELRVGRLCDSLFVFQPSADTPHDTEDRGGESLWEHYAVNIEMHANADRSRFKFFASCSAEVMSKEDLRSLLQEMALSILDFVEHPNTSCIDAAALDDDSFESTASSTLVPSRSSSSSPRRPSKIPWTQEQHTLLSILSDFGNVPLDRLDESTSLVRKKGLGRMKAGDLARCERVGEVLSLLSVFKSSSQKDFNRPPLVEIPSDVRQQVLVRIPSAFHSEVERILPVASGMEWNIGGWCASGGQSFKHAFVFSLPPHTIGDLKRSWNRLCERHAILRANFRPVQWEEHRAVMYVTSHVEFDWSELEGDLSDVTRLARAFAVEEVSPELPQTRVGIVRRGNDSAWFVLALHHFQYDAWSLRLLLDDLQFGSSFRPSLFLPKPPPLRNHILHILSYIAGLLRRRLRWLFQFIIITYRKLRTLCVGSPPVQPQISRQSKVYRFFTPEEVGHLEERSKLLDRPLANILIAAWGRLQAEASGTLDATFSLSTSGRTLDTIPDIENLAIPTYNILPLHVTSAYQQPLAEIAKEIQSDVGQSLLRGRTDSNGRYIQIYWTGDWTKTVQRLRKRRKTSAESWRESMVETCQGQSHSLRRFLSTHRLKLPYHARPWTLEHERNSVLPEFDYTHTVEIVFSSSGTLTFSLETDIAEAYMDTIAHKWKNLVQEALS